MTKWIDPPMHGVTAAFRAVGDPTRARIVKLLEGGELCVCQIQAAVGFAPSTVSKHLSILRSAGLVADRQDGRWAYYSLARAPRESCAAEVLRLLRRSLTDDPGVLADKRRLAEILKLDPRSLCLRTPAAAPRAGAPDARRARTKIRA